MARRRRVHAARRLTPAVLARDRRHRRGLVSATSSTRRCPSGSKRAAGPIYTLLDQKYYFDRFNDWFFAGGARALGAFLSTVGDRTIIDGFFVNGTARLVGWTASLLRHIQSGYVYHYAFTMILGVFALLTWWTR